MKLLVILKSSLQEEIQKTFSINIFLNSEIIFLILISKIAKINNSRGSYFYGKLTIGLDINNRNK